MQSHISVLNDNYSPKNNKINRANNYSLIKGISANENDREADLYAAKKIKEARND